MRIIITYLSLDPDRGLGHQPLFWLAILSPVVLALGLGTPVWLDYRLAFTSEAYQTFLTISKLPIGISSLAIPLGILIGRLHGTKQTAKQIENTQIQIRHTEQDNRSKLYLAHFEHFCKHIDYIEQALVSRHTRLLQNNEPYRLDKLGLYKMLYPDNSLIAGVKPTSDFLKQIAGEMERMIAAYNNLTYSHQPVQGAFDTFCKKLNDLEGQLHIVQTYSIQYRQPDNSIFIKIGKGIRLFKQTFIYGFSETIEDYRDQVEYFVELFRGIQSFDVIEEHRQISYELHKAALLATLERKDNKAVNAALKTLKYNVKTEKVTS